MTTPTVAHKGSLARTIKAVAWSFVGIRKNSEYQDDLRKLNPFHVVLVGIGAAMLLVVGLIVLVNVVAG
jgi:amino acid transporter